jgi:hypothetical protein
MKAVALIQACLAIAALCGALIYLFSRAHGSLGFDPSWIVQTDGTSRLPNVRHHRAGWRRLKQTCAQGRE